MAQLRLDDLGGLELLVAAIGLGSISAAAREHHVSQPSATARLRTLERRLGVTLLRRGPTGSVATQEGEAVAEWAREVLLAVEHLSAGVTALGTGDGRRRLRIMASLTIAEYVMPAWLTAYRRSGGSAVELAVGNSQMVARAVASGESALGFVETPRRLVGVRSTTVGGDALRIVVSPTHPWANRSGGVSAELIASTPFLLRERGSGTRDAFEAALARLDLTPCEPLAVLGSTTTLKSSCVGGEGPSVLSELAIVDELKVGTLVAVDVPDLDLSRDFKALWRPNSNDREIQRFIKFARATSRR